MKLFNPVKFACLKSLYKGMINLLKIRYLHFISLNFDDLTITINLNF